MLVRFLARTACVLISISPLLALAGSDGDAKPDTQPKALTTLSAHLGWHILKSFETAAPGITGYVIEDKNGKVGIVYGYHDFVISGVLLDAGGSNLSKKSALPLSRLVYHGWPDGFLAGCLSPTRRTSLRLSLQKP